MNKCEECGLGNEWNGKPLKLQKHKHRTGNPIFLCPNCHTQTDDFAGRCQKGIPKSKEHREKISLVQKGKVFSEETRKKLSIAKMGNIPWNTGLKLGPDIALKAWVTRRERRAS